ncbi:MAG: dihydrofolate synthase / folylpolyglutamate synthase, partial [Burkholderiales bacterium]
MQNLPTTLAAWLTLLEKMHPKAIDMGLERVAQVKDRLGLRFDCPVITVGGTNGKGSTCAMLESILMQAGYRVGLYTSPHLLHFNERARINGELVSDDALIESFAAVEARRG